jgi:hypothetical protein
MRTSIVSAASAFVIASVAGCGARTSFGEFDPVDAGARDSFVADSFVPVDTTPLPDTTPPSNDIVEDNFVRCDDGVPSSWRSCGDDTIPRGKLCATRSAYDVCYLLADECATSASPFLDTAVAFCGVDFFATPTHMIGMDVDLHGCVEDFYWVGISESDAQCLADWVMHRRFSCIGAESISSCPGPL